VLKLPSPPVRLTTLTRQHPLPLYSPTEITGQASVGASQASVHATYAKTDSSGNQILLAEHIDDRNDLGLQPRSKHYLFYARGAIDLPLGYGRDVVDNDTSNSSFRYKVRRG